MKNIDFKNVPDNWALCFAQNCNLSKECMRYIAGKSVSADLKTATTVLPQLQTKKGCAVFQKVKEERLAWGFTHIFDDVTHKQYLVMRKAMEEYLGSRFEYYRYHRGVRKLRAKQQAGICELFAYYGYAKDVVFDHYETVPIFE